MNLFRNLLIWLSLVAVAIAVFDFLSKGSSPRYTTLAFSDFLNKVEENSVSSVIIQGPNLEGKFTDNKDFITYLPDYPNLIDVLKKHNVSITAAPLETRMSSLLGMIFPWIPVLFFIGILFFIMRQMNAGQAKP